MSGARPARELRCEVTSYELEHGGPERVDIIDVHTRATVASLAPAQALLLTETLRQAVYTALDRAEARRAESTKPAPPAPPGAPDGDG